MTINPVVSFIIGLAIILGASILNAAGLNITKLDHVRVSSIPKASRKADWMRPLWLLGMVLYILSQLIGSTLALEYMRAEYVAPLGSSSLVFNFLFARFLVGTPVTSNDIYGTIVVVLGVVGIVAFGSINSGFATETDVGHLTVLWRRGGWLGYFFFMALSLIFLIVCTGKLDSVLAARHDLSSVPFGAGLPTSKTPESGPRSRNIISKLLGMVHSIWRRLMSALTEWLELWTAPKDDTTIAWILGIGWACCGGGLAGGCLVFAKATVKLMSGSLSHENPGNQFGHAAPVFTIIILSTTAVMQIICLNRGLKIYDSTLVVPVFYGVYTATGFLDSLIFNNEVDAYQPWTLFLIFVSIFILISGVVLLTHKKPEPGPLSARATTAAGFPRLQLRPLGASRKGKKAVDDDEQTVVGGEEEEEVMWSVGEAESDGEGEDEDVDHPQHPLYNRSAPQSDATNDQEQQEGERARLLASEEDPEYSAPVADR
ncbi:hypothetical protein FB45DRAFT_892927 [Roridomyces roridus]|uniref:Magnesium transporter n=1 Tax=Roridomyces roridus TaxID=1738132 RepID=A0AAD7FZ80_9AGAR|nr:hypothetical protein FB45DRAFT_892927 [Roridomyces roridus]